VGCHAQLFFHVHVHVHVHVQLMLHLEAVTSPFEFNSITSPRSLCSSSSYRPWLRYCPPIPPLATLTVTVPSSMKADPVFGISGTSPSCTRHPSVIGYPIMGEQGISFSPLDPRVRNECRAHCSVCLLEGLFGSRLSRPSFAPVKLRPVQRSRVPCQDSRASGPYPGLPESISSR
jgi:hypothetical protein